MIEKFHSFHQSEMKIKFKGSMTIGGSVTGVTLFFKDSILPSLLIA